MATAIVDTHTRSPGFHIPHRSSPSFSSWTGPNIPPRNEVELTRDRLIRVLEHLSALIAQHFTSPVRLVAHGGACMLLHPGLHKLAQYQARHMPDKPVRQTTRDVDYIHRAFVAECRQSNLPNGPQKLLACIRQTAQAFQLGADWMNSDADVALPMATDPTGRQYDPVYAASIQKSNIDLHTVFSAKNGMLVLVSVAPFWAVALKLVRYTKWDPGDICILLKLGTALSDLKWSAETVEYWLSTFCWTMGYAQYDPQRKFEMRRRINHAIQMVNAWGPADMGMLVDDEDRERDLEELRREGVSLEMAMSTNNLDPQLFGEADRTGWESSFIGNWKKQNDSPPQRIQQHFPSPSVFPPPPIITHSTPVATSGIPPPPFITNTQQSQFLSPHTQGSAHRTYSESRRSVSSLADWGISPAVEKQYQERERSRSRSTSRHHSPEPGPIMPAFQSPSPIYVRTPQPPQCSITSPYVDPNVQSSGVAAGVSVSGSLHHLRSTEEFDRGLGQLLDQSKHLAGYQTHHGSYVQHAISPMPSMAWTVKPIKAPKSKSKSKFKSKEKARKKKEKKRDRARERARVMKWTYQMTGSGLVIRSSESDETSSESESPSDEEKSSSEDDYGILKAEPVALQQRTVYHNGASIYAQPQSQPQPQPQPPSQPLVVPGRTWRGPPVVDANSKAAIERHTQAIQASQYANAILPHQMNTLGLY